MHHKLTHGNGNKCTPMPTKRIIHRAHKCTTHTQAGSQVFPGLNEAGKVESTRQMLVASPQPVCSSPGKSGDISFFA